jgi:RNA polymerase sigma-70 factor, ECF subfamily
LPADPTRRAADASRLETLLRATAAGDRAAFAELYASTAPQLFAIALRILRQRDRAEDVLQESFVAIWQRARDFDAEKGGPMTWLITVLRNRAIDALRRGARQPERLAEGEDALMALAPPTAPSAAASCAPCRTASASLAPSRAAPC